jgi:hypothetical protein
MDPECVGEDIQWVSYCWIQICCISSALDGTENDILWQDTEDENDESDCLEVCNGDEESEKDYSEYKSQFPENAACKWFM